jgi:Ser/Thr protein kinase RdoA (MazF antagonist)
VHPRADRPPDRPIDEAFFSLTPERVLASVEVGGRRATGYAFALNSLENRVYDVELEDGTRLVTKFYRPGRWSKDAILEEHAFLRELEEAEVPVVPPMDLGDGTTLRAVAEEEGRAIYCAAFARVRGRASEELDVEQAERLGRLIARLHLVGERRPAPARLTLDPATYGTRSIETLEAGPYVPDELRGRFFGAARELVALCEPAFAGLELVRLHGDCHHGNLLWDASGPFFLDFDDFLSGPPVQDLWLLAPGRDAEAIGTRAIMAEAYQSIRRFDTRTLRLVEPLRALRILRYAAWIAQRYADPAFQRAFADFGEIPYWQRELASLTEQLEHVRAALG